MTMDAPLKRHQVEGVAWAQRVGRGLLADEPGLGKSRIAIESVAGCDRVLVVAPSLVLTGGTWDDEISRWATNPDAFTQVPYSMLNQRERTGRGSGTTPVEKLRPEVAGPWDALIVDEAHYTKGRKTSWTWAVEQVARRTPRVLEMTGTPIPNWAHELFTLLRVLHVDQAKPGGEYGSFWRWAKQWFDCSPTRWSNGMPVAGELLGCLQSNGCLDRPPSDPCEHYAEFTRANLGDRYLRRLRSECLDLPPITTQEVHTPLDAAARRTYRDLKKEFVAEVDGQEVLAWTQGAKHVLLDKLSTSPWLLTKQGAPRGGKFEQLRFDLEARSRPTLVLAHYRDTVDACMEVARSVGARSAKVHGGVPRAEQGRAVAQFKAGKLDVLVGSLETLAEGLTLTVADQVVFVETSYKPSRNEQARYRVHRMGQTRPVTVREYVTPETVDSKKRALVAVKTDRQMRYLTAAQFQALV